VLVVELLRIRCSIEISAFCYIIVVNDGILTVENYTSHSLLPFESTPHYHWPPSTRAPVILSDPFYDILNDFLLELDFAGVELAAESITK
jgi:hypothetical protein